MTGRSLLLEKPKPQFGFGDLRVFTSIPDRHHDVTHLLGQVVVYETDGLCREHIQDGCLYVVEDQRPTGGMSWETHDEFNQRHARGQPRVRIHSSRRVIKAARCHHDPDLWWQVLPSGAKDGPIKGWAMAFNFVGKVVGIYRPDCSNCQ